MSDKTSKTEANFAQTLDGIATDFSREQQDIALAATALRSGVLTERQLASALGSWTIHGSVSLAEHLVSTGLLNEASRQQISGQASSYLESCLASGLGGSRSPSESVLTSTLDSIDPSGKIARLMGIRAAAGKGAVESADRRSAMLGYRLVRKIGQGGLG